MKVINNVKIRNCDQWLAGFVRRIMKKAGINCDVVAIDAFEDNFISISVDGNADTYKIMIDGSLWHEEDYNGLPCAEKLSWVLFKKQDKNYIGILTGAYKVSWENKFEEYFPQEAIQWLAMATLKAANVNTSNARIQFCQYNSIAVEVGDVDYVISILGFPMTNYNQENMVMEFEVPYILRMVVYDESTGCGKMTDVEYGEAELRCSIKIDKTTIDDSDVFQCAG